MKTVCLLIPVYNESENIEALLKRLDRLSKEEKKYNFEFLFIDDGSKDSSLQIVKNFAEKDSRISYVSLSRNFGKETAIIAGLDNTDSDAVVVIDADLQDPPELISKMLFYWEKGYDDIYARRLTRAGESWMKKKTSSMFYSLLQHSTQIEIQKDTGDFRLLDKKCVDALKQFRESQRYTKGMFSWIGFKKKEITYNRDPRNGGKSKWNYFKLFNFAIEGLVSFTTAPLRWSTISGTIVSFLAFIYIVILVVKTIIFGNSVSGYPSLMAVILFLGGVQLLSLGIIGEYVARIFNETKNRPLYIIQESYVRDRGIDGINYKTF